MDFNCDKGGQHKFTLSNMTKYLERAGGSQKQNVGLNAMPYLDSEMQY